jgi:hypothetical protein
MVVSSPHGAHRGIAALICHSNDFMQRVEVSFKALHERLEALERRQVGHGPSDEQVERVLRKILAERFADQQLDRPSEPKDSRLFVKRPNKDTPIPSALAIDATLLQVDPDAVPSNAYMQTFQMLEKGLQSFPAADVSKSALKDGVPTVNHVESKEPRHASTSADAKPW